MSSPVSYDLQGQGGGVVLDGTSGSINGNFRWVQVINDVVFADITSNNIVDTAGLIGITIPAGVGFGGRFQTISITSGVVIAYYA